MTEADKGFKPTLLDELARQTAALKKKNSLLEEARATAERANLAKSQFLASMSHEIRTPLNGIFSLTELMLLEHQDSAFAEDLETIRGCVCSLKSMIEEILDFSKIEAGRLEIERDRFNFQEELANVCRCIETMAEEKGIQFLFKTSGPHLEGAIGDPGRFRQILFNILGNAVKFTPASGRVTLSVCTTLINDTATVEIVVEDNGPGIPTADISKIFEPFSQADQSITRLHEGTGLGLAISKRLVELMGGSLQVKSELGFGAKFLFSLSFQTFQPDLSSREETIRKRSKRMHRRHHLLLVEDNEVNRTVTARLLRRHGFRVSSASSGNEAIAALQSQAFNLALLDIHLPEMSGLDIAEKIRRGDAGSSEIPLVALTADARASLSEECLKKGFSAFVTKPFAAEELLEKIETSLSMADSCSFTEETE